MQKRIVNILAQDEQEAAIKGSKELNTHESNIQCKKIDEDKYQVAILNADAELDIVIAHDGIKAFITDYQGAIGNGDQLDQEKLKQYLHNAGLSIEPDLETLDMVLERINRGQAINDLEIARGIAPQEPLDAYIELQNNNNYPVFPNNTIGKVIPPQAPQPGKRVDGLPINPKDNREPKTIEAPEKKGLIIEEQTGEVKAKGYGKVIEQDGQVTIKPLFKLIDKGLSLIATLHHLDFHENPITVEDIKQVALDIGCQEEDIHEKEIAKTLKKAKKQNEPQENVLIATGGFEPQEPQDAYIEFYGNKDLPVFPGHVFARRIAPAGPKQGQTIIGKPIAPQDNRTAKDINIPERAFWHIEHHTNELVAKAYGIIAEKQGQMTIKPLLRISKDRLKMFAAIYPMDYFEKAITLEQIKKTIAQITTKINIKEENVSRALKEAAASSEKQIDTLIAEGYPPEKGNDAKLVLQNKETKKEDETGKIDFHKISAFYSVNEGDIIATLFPPTSGKPGIDIFGKQIAPQKGEPIDISPGENVQTRRTSVSPQTLTATKDMPQEYLDNYKNKYIEIVEFLALSSGTVKVEENQISILDLVDINGDVDYSTGNIRLQNGSVKIHNTILSGFTVCVPEDIFVEGTIEDAYVEAGKSIMVKRGITGGDWGKIKSGANIHAYFIKNANIECGQDVLVDQHISNSNIKTQGMVISKKGKGKIQGGIIKASLGLDVNEIGSKYGVKTKIFLGNEFERYQNLLEEKEQLENDLQRVEEYFNNKDPEKVLSDCSAKDKNKIEQLLKYKTSAESRIEEIKKEIKEQRQKYLKECGEVKAKVRKIAHPETEFIIAKKRYLVQEPLYNITVYYDSEKGVIDVL